MSEKMTVKKIEKETSNEHHPSTNITLISNEIAARTKLTRVYVALCTIFCVTVFVLLLAKVFLLK